MNSEPFFLVDEGLLELESILKDVDFRIKNPDFEKNQIILNSFVRACARLFKKPEPEPKLPKISIPIKPKKELKQTKRTKIFPTPRPKGGKIKDFRTKTKYQEIELPKNQLPLIKDRITNKPLAVVELNDKYIIREPPITNEQVKILKKITKKKPQDPKQAWELLKKYAPKLNEDQLTNIKYYLINSLFAIGRLEPLLHDKKISGIQCNGKGEYVLIRRDGKLLKTNIIFRDRDDIDSYLKKLAKKLNKTLDEKNPILDTVHRNYRFQITLGLHGASSKFVIKKVE